MKPYNVNILMMEQRMHLEYSLAFKRDQRAFKSTDPKMNNP